MITPTATYLRYNSVKNLAFEGPEDDGFILDGIQDEAFPGLDQTRTHAVYSCHGNNKPVLSCGQKKTQV